MKKYFLQITLIPLSVFLFISLVNFVVDPFNVNRYFDFNFNKKEISYRMNYRLYKVVEFRNSPRPAILLGDSRSDALKTEYFEKAGLHDLYNFAYGGGTFYEIIDTFWYAAGITKLESVFIGIPFNIFNEAGGPKMDLVPEARSLLDNPWSYYNNLFIFKVSIANIYNKITGNHISTERPPMSREDFWRYQLSKNSIGNFYKPYLYPHSFIDSLREVVDYCRRKDIQLTIFIPPTHTDLQGKVEEYHLTKYYIQYKCELANIATVMDFDYPNSITENSLNFNDPFHSNEAIALKVVEDLVGQTTAFGRKYECKTVWQ